MSDDNNRGRRGFFRSLGRIATGGLLAGGVGWLSARSGEACLREFKCRGCPQLHECGEPQAIMMREHEGRQPQRQTAECRTQASGQRTQRTTEDGNSNDG